MKTMVLKSLRWQLVMQDIATVERDGRQLVVVVGLEGPKYNVAAVERPTPSGQVDMMQTDIERSLMSHSHKVIALQVSARKAKQLATAFARQWFEGANLEACGCGEIEVRS